MGSAGNGASGSGQLVNAALQYVVGYRAPKSCTPGLVRGSTFAQRSAPLGYVPGGPNDENVSVSNAIALHVGGNESATVSGFWARFHVPLPAHAQ